MLRAISLFLLVGCSAGAAHGQSYVDSLQLSLKNVHAATDKIDLYGKITWSYLRDGQLDLADTYADSVNLLAEELRDSTYVQKARYYYGIIARYRGEYSNALHLFNDYLNFYEARGDSARVAGVLYQIGVVHSMYGNYEKSFTAYQRCLAIEESTGNLYSVGYTLNAIGIIYKETRSFDHAIAHFNKALPIFDSLDALLDKTDVLVNLGNTFSAMEQFEVAMKYYREAMLIDEQTGKRHGLALSLANIAFLFDNTGRFDSALVYHKRALVIREKLPFSEGLTRSLIGVGRGYLQLRLPEKARPYLRRALQITDDNHSKPLLRDTHLNLSKMHEQLGDTRNALLHFKLYELYKDSILNEESAKAINELQIKHEVTDKVRQIALLESERQLQQAEARRAANLKAALIAGLAFVIILAALAIYAIRQRYLVAKKTNQIKEANLRHQLSELKIKALRAQINPHFMFNCLNSINRMITKGDNDNASLYLKKFSKLVRLIVENGEANRVSLGNELALIESYIQLEELRFKNKIGYEIQIDENIEKENTFLPPMILQPFVENSIWHGLTHKNGGHPGLIKIAVREDNETLLCMIEDNGVGRELSRKANENIPGKTRSVGLSITEERLKLLSSERLRDLIRIVDLKDSFDTAVGTRVEIRIPLS